MGAIKNVLKAVVSPIGAALGVFKKPKALPAPVAQPTITPSRSSAAADALAARRGSAANMRTGAGGAESGATAKKALLGT